MDHLRQEARLSLGPSAGVVRNWPRDSTMEENFNRIKDAIPPYFKDKVVVGAKPNKGLAVNRGKCDLCVSMADVSCCLCFP
jgi:hypothetical protein